MMAFLAASCIVVVIVVSLIVALETGVEYLRLLFGRRLPASARSRWPSGPAARVRSEAPLASRWRQDEGGWRAAAKRDLGHAPEARDGMPGAPRSAAILPFVRRPACGRRAWQYDPPPDAA